MTERGPVVIIALTGGQMTRALERDENLVKRTTGRNLVQIYSSAPRSIPARLVIDSPDDVFWLQHADRGSEVRKVCQVIGEGLAAGQARGNATSAKCSECQGSGLDDGGAECTRCQGLGERDVEAEEAGS